MGAMSHQIENMNKGIKLLESDRISELKSTTENKNIHLRISIAADLNWKKKESENLKMGQ